MNNGEKMHRQVMGDEFVDRALTNTNEFTQLMQDYINQHGWGATLILYKNNESFSDLNTISLNHIYSSPHLTFRFI